MQLKPRVTRWKTLQLGAESENSAGTEGDFNIAHNLFLIANAEDDPAGPILVHGNVDRVTIANNVFMPLGAARFQPYYRGGVWDVERSRAFAARRGNGEPAVFASHNWVSSAAVEAPGFFTNTIRGRNPGFAGAFAPDYRPGKGSPLARAGPWPLPAGRMGDLLPRTEPERGVPSDLRARPRKETINPSIGPFDAVE